MTGLEIGLIVIGLAFFVGSFFFTEKLSSSDLEVIEKMSEKEMNVLLEKQMKQAADRIAQTIDTKMAASLGSAEHQLNKTANECIKSIADTVGDLKKKYDSDMGVAEKTLNEISFMYSMLNNKQQKLGELEQQAEVLSAQIRQLKQNIEDELLPQLDPKGIEMPQNVEVVMSETVSTAIEDNHPIKEVMEEQVAKAHEKDDLITDDNVFENVNEKIIELHREGYSDVDIAKRLGKGLGEIKLVLGLYDEEA